jgi:hypothetical protein
MQLLTVSNTVWIDVAMDFVKGFPKVGGKSVILTVVDRFSKSDRCITIGHPYSTVSAAKASFDTVIRLHGVPTCIVSNRDPVFTSALWQELFRLCDTTLQISSAFQPQTNGQSEVTKSIIIM